MSTSASKKFILIVAILISYSSITKAQLRSDSTGFFPDGYTLLHEEDKMVRKYFPEDWRITNLRIGDEFPTFSLIDMQGDSILSEDLVDKVAVLNFTFVGCSGCKMEQDNLKLITEHYAENDNVIFINFINSKEWRIKWYLNKYGNKGYIPVSVDDDIYKELFEIVTAPTHMIVKDGEIVEALSVPLADERANSFIYNIIDSSLQKLESNDL